MRRLVVTAAAAAVAALAAAGAAFAGPDLPGGPRPGQSFNCWLQETLGYENVRECDGTSG